jgi:hypothetical protein
MLLLCSRLSKASATLKEIMATENYHTPELFARQFRDVIRVGLNWERFFEESWPIEPVILSTHADLERCFLPWYIDKGGEEVAYDDPEAAPMRLTDVPKIKGILNDERQEDIHDKVTRFRDGHGIIEFSAPTYSLPDSQYFVLDRNHRLSALTMVSVPFEVTLWNVRGPLDSDCLLDLIHWERKS